MRPELHDQLRRNRASTRLQSLYSIMLEGTEAHNDQLLLAMPKKAHCAEPDRSFEVQTIFRDATTFAADLQFLRVKRRIPALQSPILGKFGSSAR